ADVTASGATIELLGPDAPVGEPPVAPTMQMLTVPDLTGDEYADVLTVDSVGQLHVRAGKGDGSFGPPVLDGRGWHKMTIYAPGDWTGDGVADLLARDREG